MIVASITMVWRLFLGKAAEAIPSSPMVGTRSCAIRRCMFKERVDIAKVETNLEGP
jgi:hypothetical protein